MSETMTYPSKKPRGRHLEVGAFNRKAEVFDGSWMTTKVVKVSLDDTRAPHALSLLVAVDLQI